MNEKNDTQLTEIMGTQGQRDDKDTLNTLLDVKSPLFSKGVRDSGAECMDCT